MVPIFIHLLTTIYRVLATHQTLRSKTPHSFHPHALTVSLLECTKDRVNGAGTESQILPNPQRGAQPEPSGRNPAQCC